jgi:hypothetical protein
VLVKREKRKIPRNAVESLMQTCEMLSEEWEKPAAEIFKSFLDLMNRYADYFFSKPCPEKYDYEEATTFTDEDIDFLFESEEEFVDRYTTVCIKKNMNLECGFQGYFGLFWTQQAFHEKFVRPGYKPVLEVFDTLARGDEDARKVLNMLKEQFSAKLIHESLIDLFEHTYPDESTRRLVEEMFELLHTGEGLPPCKDYRCSWYQRQKYPSEASYG